jgi:hypothetical protein
MGGAVHVGLSIPTFATCEVLKKLPSADSKVISCNIKNAFCDYTPRTALTVTICYISLECSSFAQSVIHGKERGATGVRRLGKHSDTTALPQLNFRELNQG